MIKYLCYTALIGSVSLLAEESCCQVCYSPQYYDLQCDYGLYFSIDFLYWLATESNLSYAVQTTTAPNGAVVPKKIKNLSLDWDPGVRAGLGFNSACDGWDFFLNWTYFKNTREDSSSNALINPWTLYSSTLFDKVFAKWDFRLNLLDLELGRRYWVSPCFNMRPLIFLRGAWTKTIFSLQSTLGELVDSDRFNNRFCGGGFGLGIQPAWYFTPCFNLYANFALSLLWGEYRMRKHALFNTRSDFSSMQPIADLGMGLSYVQTFCNQRYQAQFSAGWEQHYWWDYAERFKTASSIQFIQTCHSLGFGGLVFRARLDF